MASNALLLTIMIALTAAPALAKDYVVGDETGWRLVFNYTKGFHNVYTVNEPAFQQCSVPPPSEALTSGKDKITLSTPGKKWFICGVGKHCANGMKFEITVES
ncbi:hypothetical protein ACS0TY_004471 [Phlomoides rotata]